MRALIRSLAATLAVAALFAPTARADGGPSPGVAIDGRGVTDARTGVSYATRPAPGGVTRLEARNRRGAIIRSRRLDGPYGVPLVTFDNDRGGLSHDGRTLFVALATGGPGLALATRLIAVDTATLETVRTIDLHGDFSFDALAPDGRTLFLIQHTSARYVERYRVRAYDLRAGRLLPRAIVDKAEPQMAGQPVARLASPDGSWVYTLYTNPATEPFVHALDTVHLVAHCLDIHWDGDQVLLWTARLGLDAHKLTIRSRYGLHIATVRLPRAEPSGSGAGPAAAASGAALLAVGLGFAVRRRYAARARSVRNAGPSAGPPRSTGSNRSPWRSIRSSASRRP